MTSISLVPKGETFTRMAIATALAATRSGFTSAADIASDKWGPFSPATRILKTAIAAGGFHASSDWGSELQTFQTALAEFFELVLQRSIVGRLAGIRRVPLRTRLVNPVTGSSAYWIGKGKSKPISKVTFDQGSLEPLTVAGMLVITKELLQNSDPRSEGWIKQDLIRALSEAIDTAFLDPSGAAVPDVSPASIVDGISAIAGSGQMPDDIQNLLERFQGNLEFAFFVMSPYAATQITSANYPNVGARGGEIAGIPVITSSNVPSGLIALIDAGGIAIAQGDAVLKASQQASIDMADSASVVDGATNHVSMFQADCVALLAEQVVNWQRMRDSAVKYIENATWAMQTIET